jgi:hypothetical protein
MRNGQNKQRMRGRNNNNRKGQNPLTRIYESNGPDVKIRGTASHVADKYVQLARDAQSSGDPVAAEAYYQHAEHYFRLIATVQEQFRQNNPYYREGDTRDGNYDDSDEEAGDQAMSGEPYAPREQAQPYQARDAQPYQPREQRFPPREQPQPYPPRSQPQSASAGEEAGEADGLPAFVTGGGQPNVPAHPGYGQNGYEGGAPDRFPLHRRRRRRHGPREGAPSGEPGETPGVPRNPGE